MTFENWLPSKMRQRPSRSLVCVKRDLLQCQKRPITKQNAPKAERPRVQPKQGAQDVEKDSARGRTEEIEAHETYLVSNLV
jgi:hypothetical protein